MGQVDILSDSKSDDAAMTPLGISSHFPAEELVGHFLLSKRKQKIAWNNDSIGNWTLAVQDRLPCSRIYIEDKAVGWLLGHAISPDGKIVENDLQLQSDDIEASIYSHGGRFLVILPILQRVYMDPCGLLSAVYCKHAELVASSPSLIPYDELTKDRARLLQSTGIPHVNAMFPVGMTSRHAVERIIPNHYLDLGTWKIERHWPDRALLPVDDVSAAIKEISSITKRQLRAIVKHGPTTLRLTAGKDSRMLLACARDFVDDLECVTADLNDHDAQHDCQVAEKLSKIAGVPYRAMQWVEPEPRDLDLWLFRTGFGTGEVRGWRGCTTYRTQFDPNRSDLLGSAGEVARAFFWSPDDGPNTEISGERLLRHCNCPVTPETTARVEDWISGAIANDSLQLLDLFYVEQRVGCWAGVWANAEAAIR